MKKSINLIELIIACSAVFGTALLFWKNTDVRLSGLEIRIEKQEQNSDKIMQKLDALQMGINDLKVSLQNKEDRK